MNDHGSKLKFGGARTNVHSATDTTSMLNRRSFVAAAAGFGLSSALAVNGVVADTNVFDVLGRSPCTSLAHEALHPISPERVIVMSNSSRDTCSANRGRQENLLRATMTEPFEVRSIGGLSLGTFHAPEKKLPTIFGIVRAMTDYYSVPHLFENWATGLARREALGSTAIGHGFGLIHQFQDDDPVQPMNGSVDWWLVLFPGGIEWDAADDKLVFGMIAHVFSEQSGNVAGIKLRSWMLATCIGGSIQTFTGGYSWANIAHMDQLLAARRVNRALLSQVQSIVRL